MAFGSGSSSRNNPLHRPAKDSSGTRVKQVFTTDKIAHLWAHQTQSSARNSQGNFYFDGPTIYSYGSHFPIACHVVNKKGERAIWFTTGKYSSTTSKHIWDVRNALPPEKQIFHFELSRGIAPNDDYSPDSYAYRTAVAAYVSDIQTAVDAAQLARQTKTIEGHLLEARARQTELNAFVSFFGLPGMSVKARIRERKLPYIPVDATEAKLLGKDARVKRDAEDKAYKARQAADALERARTYLARYPEYLVKWDGTIEQAVSFQTEIDDARRATERAEQFARSKVELQTWMNEHADIALTWDGEYDSGCELRRIWIAENRERERAERLARWIAGDSSVSTYSLSYGSPIVLRVINGEVETSLGATFPVEHARKGLMLVRAVMARGEEWKRNGHTLHLGHYQIDRITPDGTVYAGCHTVPFASIEAIATQLEII